MSLTYIRNSGALPTGPPKSRRSLTQCMNPTAFSSLLPLPLLSNILRAGQLRPLTISLTHHIFFNSSTSMNCPFKMPPFLFLYPVGFLRISSKGLSSEKPSGTFQDSESQLSPSLPLGEWWMQLNASWQCAPIAPICSSSHPWGLAHAGAQYGTQICRVQLTSAAPPVCEADKGGCGVLGSSASCGHYGFHPRWACWYLWLFCLSVLWLQLLCYESLL